METIIYEAPEPTITLRLRTGKVARFTWKLKALMFLMRVLRVKGEVRIVHDGEDIATCDL
ncbi:MAG: hypothetical protein E6Q97_10695 [Desulfurellales bacterium]|nr:MAG: hypothetical protein E6Q97_10695 [Desulfurellales bacterium]